MQSGSGQLQAALANYAALADQQDAAKQKRRQETELALQGMQNEGQANVATIRNTGAMDIQKSTEAAAQQMQKDKLTAEAPVQAAQANSLNAHAQYYDTLGQTQQMQKGALAKQEQAKADLFGAQAENQSFTTALAKKYGEQKVSNELAAQGAATDKVGMELDLLKQDYDKSQMDAGMKRAQEYQTHPDVIAKNMLADWRTERAAAAQVNPLLMTAKQSEDYSNGILGEPGLMERLAGYIPLVGAGLRTYRSYQARNKAAAQSGIALPQ